MAEKKFLMGNEILGQAARAAGARAFYGYPITPSSEIAHFWAKEACSEGGQKDDLVFLQAEDEIGAGFMLIGGILAGTRSFTATAGPGHILMQDSLAMAEAMRLPCVYYVMQRGGPSTSTVIYSQQEVNLACFGGNGNGYRIVYSPSNLQEMFDYGIRVFDVAWKYRFPTILLGDGMLAKTLGEVETYSVGERGLVMAEPEAYMLERSPRKRPIADIMPSPEFEVRAGEDGTEYDCYRNCLNWEEEALAVNEETKDAFVKAAEEVTEWEEYGQKESRILVVAHGIVSAGVKSAIDQMGTGEARLFRPITLRPFPERQLREAAVGADRIIIAESADNQLGRIVKDALYGSGIDIVEHYRPSISILPEEIVGLIRSNAD
ncbi:ferredoxin oxidoreductase [Candidatus Uhrbacteria bacterium]|nr:ferredoxin oxidoreductase [Candidatus Uhrbacteria bacterium]